MYKLIASQRCWERKKEKATPAALPWSYSQGSSVFSGMIVFNVTHPVRVLVCRLIPQLNEFCRDAP